jgi:hypothetical protein
MADKFNCFSFICITYFNQNLRNSIIAIPPHLSTWGFLNPPPISVEFGGDSCKDRVAGCGFLVKTFLLFLTAAHTIQMAGLSFWKKNKVYNRMKLKKVQVAEEPQTDK